MKLQVFASVVLACAVPMLAFAQQAAPQSEPASARAAATAAAEKRECHYEEVTGSHFKKKTCHTHEEWERMKADAQTAVREHDARPTPMLGY